MTQARTISLGIHAASTAREQPVDRTAEMDLLRRVQAGDQERFKAVRNVDSFHPPGQTPGLAVWLKDQGALFDQLMYDFFHKERIPFRFL